MYVAITGMYATTMFNYILYTYIHAYVKLSKEKLLWYFWPNENHINFTININFV